MLAGTTQHRVGTRIKITSIASNDPDEQDVVGLKGELTHPFPGIMWPGVKYTLGVRLDNGQIMNLMAGDKFDVLEEEAPVAAHA